MKERQGDPRAATVAVALWHITGSPWVSSFPIAIVADYRNLSVLEQLQFIISHY